MLISLGNDHAGVEVKKHIENFLRAFLKSFEPTNRPFWNMSQPNSENGYLKMVCFLAQNFFKKVLRKFH